MSKLRAWWWHQQGLDGSLRGASPAQVLERSGWARSVGGAGPYLTLFARAGTRRADADAAVAALRIHELPAVRGCTYVVPERDFALALRAGQEFAGGDMRTARKLGVTDEEVERLGGAVLRALESGGALEPDALRDATGSAWRSLGEEGRRKGVTTTLPLALGQLQASGKIRRVPTNGRLDQQRYAYTAWSPSPVDTFALDDQQVRTEVARRFFEWVGPATMGELAWFTALGVKVLKAAVEPLGLVPAPGQEDRLLLPEQVEAWESFEAPDQPQYALVSSLDAISATRRDVQTLLGDGDSERQVPVDSGTRPLGGLNDLPGHAVLERGRLIGIWEFDSEARELVWATFTPNRDPALLSLIGEMEAYVRDDLGDARSFSLDSPKSRRPRLEELRRMRG
jgi:hypothetical protein